MAERTRQNLETCLLILVQIRNLSSSPGEINRVHVPTERCPNVAIDWGSPLAYCALADELLTVIGLSRADQQQNTEGRSSLARTVQCGAICGHSDWYAPSKHLSIERAQEAKRARSSQGCINGAAN
jgi:hypothetical protein